MTINLNLGVNSYNIYLERGALNKACQLLNLNRKVLIVTDDGVPTNYSKAIAAQSKQSIIVTLKQGEDTKSFDSLKKLCKIMLDNNFTRKDCVVAVGGGVIGDLSGFAAASFMRGIDFYNIPTTVLSQVDSSIGGKVAINFEGIKNIIGAFYQPKAVIIDPEVLKTLPARQISNGLAEAVKMGLTSDDKLFKLFEEGNIEANLDEIIERSLLVKKNVVELDEKENGLRMVLNFGHTIGHAIESTKFSELYHGECVGLGMLYMCSESVKKQLVAVLKKLNLPTEILLNNEEVKNALLHDKKAREGFISVVFVRKVGSYEIIDKPLKELLKIF